MNININSKELDRLLTEIALLKEKKIELLEDIRLLQEAIREKDLLIDKLSTILNTCKDKEKVELLIENNLELLDYIEILLEALNISDKIS